MEVRVGPMLKFEDPFWNLSRDVVAHQLSVLILRSAHYTEQERLCPVSKSKGRKRHHTGKRRRKKDARKEKHGITQSFFHLSEKRSHWDVFLAVGPHHQPHLLPSHVGTHWISNTIWNFISFFHAYFFWIYWRPPFSQLPLLARQQRVCVADCVFVHVHESFCFFVEICLGCESSFPSKT